MGNIWQLMINKFQVLSDLTKKKNYDVQLRKEESGRVCQGSSTASQKVLIYMMYAVTMINILILAFVAKQEYLC